MSKVSSNMKYLNRHETTKHHIRVRDLMAEALEDATGNTSKLLVKSSDNRYLLYYSIPRLLTLPRYFHVFLYGYLSCSSPSVFKCLQTLLALSLKAQILLRGVAAPC